MDKVVAAWRIALVVAMGCGVSNAAAQTDKYPGMAAIDEYLMGSTTLPR